MKNTRHKKSQKKTHKPQVRLMVFVINKLWLLLATLVITAALIFSLLRLLLPQIDFYKADIETWIETSYQVDVEIADISAAWESSGPVLFLEGFKLKSDDGQLSLAEFESLSVHIDAFRSLLNARAISKNILLSGAKVNFLLDRKLAVRIDTLDELSEPASESEVIDVESSSHLLLTHLFSHKKLQIVDSLISLETLRGDTFNYFVNQLDIDNFGDIHQIQGRLEDEYQGQIQLVAELFGEPSVEASHSKIFIQAKDIDLSQLPIYSALPQLKPNSGRLNWRLWSEWRDGRWNTAVGDLLVENARWQNTITSDQVKPVLTPSVETLSLDFNWAFNSPQTGMLVINQGSLISNSGGELKVPPINFNYRHLNERDLVWEIATKGLDISALSDYLPLVNSLKVETDIALNESHGKPVSPEISGIVEYAAIRLARQQGVWQSPIITSQFVDLGFSEATDKLTISRVNGQLDALLKNQDGFGTIQLNGQNSKFVLPELFREPLSFDDWSVDMNWQFDVNGLLDLRFEQAHAKNSDLTLNANSRFFYQEQEAEFLLYAELSDLKLANKSLYLPSGIMSDGLTQYLDSSVESGNIAMTKAVVHGALAKFPYQKGDGLFAIDALLDKGKYRFLPDWPVINELKARLEFVGNGMNIMALAGESAGIQLNKTQAIIRDFSAENTPLELMIDATSKNNTGRDYLLKTPIRNIGESIQALNISGSLRTKIDLALGLEDSSNLTLSGKVFPTNKKTSLAIDSFKFEHLQGELFFNQLGILPSQFNALYKKQKIDAEIFGASGPQDASISIKAKGEFTPEVLSDLIDKKWLDKAKGKSAYQALVEIAPVDDPESVDLNITSDLQGLQLNLPGELNKDKSKATPLELSIKLNKESQLSLAWQKFKGRWWWTQDPLADDLGGVFLYDSPQKLSDEVPHQFLADINLQDSLWKDWLPLLTTIFSEADSNNKESKMVIPVSLNLGLAELNTPYVDLKDLQLQIIKPKDQDWQVNAENKIMQWQLDLPELKPWELKIEKLALELKPEFIAPVKEAEAGTAQIDEKDNLKQTQPEQENYFLSKPSDWPAITLNCLSCQIQGFDMGEIKADLLSENNQLTLRGKLTKDKSHQLSFELDWGQVLTNNADGLIVSQENNSELNFELNSENIGRLLKRLNYSSGIVDSSAKVVGNLQWQKMPWQFDRLAASGATHFSLSKGYLSEVSDAKARLFSLFSLQNLSRRLQLDFSDVFKKGFHYEKLNGDVQLSEGLLKSHKIFVDGSAAKVTLNGELDLKQQTIEQRALVIPHLTSSLPLLIGWAIEPTTGVIVYLLNKLFEPAIEVVSQIEYRIYGDLENIQVDEVKKSKSKVKYDKPETETETETEAEPKPNIEPKPKTEQEPVELEQKTQTLEPQV